MSYELGMDAINLRAGPRLAHTEYCDHWPLMRQVTGLPDDDPNQARAFYAAWDYDFIWSINNGPVSWEERGRTTDMGHAEFMEGGVDRREPVVSPFKTSEDVWSFDAVAEYGLTDYDELVAYYQSSYDNACARFPDQVFTGGYYRTLVSGAIAAFGWDMLLLAASDPSRFAKTLDGIFQQAMHHYRAWADTTCEVVMCHDDMVWTSGPFVRPDFYRAEIFPRYKALWDVVHQAGKKVAFTSDGDWTMFTDDVVEAGADALCFEPMVSLEHMVDRYAKSHCLIGSDVDARTLTFGTKEEIAAQIDQSLALAERCDGFIFAVGNHIPANIPLDNALFYYDYLAERWHR